MTFYKIEIQFFLTQTFLVVLINCDEPLINECMNQLINEHYPQGAYSLKIETIN